MSEKKLKPIHVQIRNYQSIESLDFEVNGFTCITGKTNIGKSAIVRAISASIQNDSVNGMVRKGAKTCSVQLKSDDWSFRWEKGGGTNRYWIPAEADKPLDKVGQGQIEPIAELGFKSVKLGDEKSYPWCADQFDPLFLLNKSGGTVTDFISDVSRLRVLQNAMIISNRAKKRANDELKVRTADLVSIQEKLSRVQSLSDFEKIIKEIDEQVESIKEYERRLDMADVSSKRLEKINAILAVIQPVSNIKLPDIEETKNKLIELRKAQRFIRIPSLRDSLESISGIDSISVPQLQSVGDDLKRLQFMEKRSRKLISIANGIISTKSIDKVKVPDLSEVQSSLRLINKSTFLNDKLKKVSDFIKSVSAKIEIPDAPPNPETLIKMSSFLKKLDTISSSMKSFDNQINKIQSELKSVQKEIESIPSCITCGRVMVNNHIHGSVGIERDNKVSRV